MGLATIIRRNNMKLIDIGNDGCAVIRDDIKQHDMKKVEVILKEINENNRYGLTFSQMLATRDKLDGDNTYTIAALTRLRQEQTGLDFEYAAKTKRGAFINKNQFIAEFITGDMCIDDTIKDGNLKEYISRYDGNRDDITQTKQGVLTRKKIEKNIEHNLPMFGIVNIGQSPLVMHVLDGNQRIAYKLRSIADAMCALTRIIFVKYNMKKGHEVDNFEHLCEYIWRVYLNRNEETQSQKIGADKRLKDIIPTFRQQLVAFGWNKDEKWDDRKFKPQSSRESDFSKKILTNPDMLKMCMALFQAHNKELNVKSLSVVFIHASTSIGKMIRIKGGCCKYDVQPHINELAKYLDMMVDVQSRDARYNKSVMKNAAYALSNLVGMSQGVQENNKIIGKYLTELVMTEDFLDIARMSWVMPRTSDGGRNTISNIATAMCNYCILKSKGSKMKKVPYLYNIEMGGLVYNPKKKSTVDIL